MPSASRNARVRSRSCSTSRTVGFCARLEPTTAFTSPSIKILGGGVRAFKGMFSLNLSTKSCGFGSSMPAFTKKASSIVTQLLTIDSLCAQGVCHLTHCFEMTSFINVSETILDRSVLDTVEDGVKNGLCVVACLVGNIIVSTPCAVSGYLGSQLGTNFPGTFRASFGMLGVPCIIYYGS
ncbi:uncharacterized protein PV07_08741 [Cladophialophora immunda]|uniref:Uncharacterized protein n=1 Tax=Cladophialophora immunda TaxID=569365 RepID=A0A0D2C551_9EURO|nr:uncharacterized protein PV07_08741 [Cladophialophora immunda]KIW25575.1 hypothetical protein PV07_08741 [Cladophialophora immunda]